MTTRPRKLLDMLKGYKTAAIRMLTMETMKNKYERSLAEVIVQSRDVQSKYEEVEEAFNSGAEFTASGMRMYPGIYLDYAHERL